MAYKVLADANGIGLFYQNVSVVHPAGSTAGLTVGLSVGIPAHLRTGHNYMTDRDTEILRTLLDHVALTVRQIIKVVGFPNEDRAQRRCLVLHKRGFLGRFQCLSSGPGRAEYVYFLSSKGLRYVQLYSMEKTQAKPTRIKNDMYLSHMLLLNDFWIDLRLARQNGPVNLDAFMPEFSHGQERGHKATRSEVIDPNSREKLSLIPDAVFCLGGPSGKKLFFLEIDRATGKIQSRNYKSFISQVKKYMWYQQVKGFKVYQDKFNYDFSGFQVLYLTTSLTRIKSYQNALGEIGKFHKFVMFACFEEINPENVLGKVWRSSRADDDGLYSLLD